MTLVSVREWDANSTACLLTCIAGLPAVIESRDSRRQTVYQLLIRFDGGE